MPASWHWSCAVHVTSWPPVHAPALQTSPRLQPLPSSHSEPSGFAWIEHAAVTGSQVAMWH
jgi:hypothetical protein